MTVYTIKTKSNCNRNCNGYCLPCSFFNFFLNTIPSDSVVLFYLFLFLNHNIYECYQTILKQQVVKITNKMNNNSLIQSLNNNDYYDFIMKNIQMVKFRGFILWRNIVQNQVKCSFLLHFFSFLFSFVLFCICEIEAKNVNQINKTIQ